MLALRKLRAKATHPRDLGEAVLRRIVPASPRFGFPWVQQADGAVTFRERGFVAAPGPSALLARHNHETRRIRRELAGARIGRSLELGCGFGRLSMVFAELSDAHVAVDINESALASARAAYPDVVFEQVSPSRLPFPDDDFDLVCSWTVLQHVRPDMIRAVCDEVLRVLAPAGTLLLCEETREPEAEGVHTWHRTVQDYEELFAPLVLHSHGTIAEIDRISGMDSPGEVMRFVDEGR
jgi:SAM-dependent methyltransferase